MFLWRLRLTRTISINIGLLKRCFIWIVYLGYKLRDDGKNCDCNQGSEGNQPVPDFIDPGFSKDQFDWLSTLDGADIADEFKIDRIQVSNPSPIGKPYFGNLPGDGLFPQARGDPAAGLFASLGNILTSLGSQPNPDEGKEPVEEHFTKEQYNPLQGWRFRDSGFGLGDFHANVDIDGHVKPKLYQTININVFQEPKPACREYTL